MTLSTYNPAIFCIISDSNHSISSLIMYNGYVTLGKLPKGKGIKSAILTSYAFLLALASVLRSS
jgi:hypothetical protein